MLKMTDAEFNRISTFLKGKYGIDMNRKREIVSGRLENYVSLGKWESYTDYMNAVEQDITGDLERKLVAMLTTNHTFFMREFEHFDYMKSTVLPYLKQKEAKSKDLHIWCGASSTGEEPYMLAMLMKDFFGLESENWDTKILATDISTEALHKAIAGEYTTEQIAVVPDSWRRRFFRAIPGTDKYVVTPELKKEVLFRQFNLMDTFPFRKKLHVVFLRNVMIYFDQETKNELLRKVYDALEPGGYLFIGRTETIDRASVPFQMIQPSIFRKQEGK